MTKEQIMSDTTFLDRALESLAARRKERKRLPTPSRRNQQIFRRVAVGGEQQIAVAADEGLTPSSICKIVKGVRRWLAAGSPGDPDLIDHVQQQRLQRQLAQERHQQIYEMSMRLAKREEAKRFDTTIRTEYKPDDNTQARRASEGSGRNNTQARSASEGSGHDSTLARSASEGNAAD